MEIFFVISGKRCFQIEKSRGVNIKSRSFLFNFLKETIRHWIMSNVAPCTDPSRLSAATRISVAVAPLGAQSENTHEA